MIIIVKSTLLSAQSYDTITIRPNHVLITIDSIYFGNTNSILILPDSVKYVITKSFKKSVDFFQSYYYSLFIKDTAIQNFRAKEAFEKSVNYYEPFKGKIIRNISIKQVDIIGGSVSDTLKFAKSKWNKSLNKSHLGSRKWIIKKNIRIKPNEALIPTLISDNERIIRNLPYIEDAKFYVIPDSIFIDSVDVIVVTKDKFPIGFTGSVSNIQEFTMLPYNKNFLGFGHTLQPEIYYDGYYSNPIGYGGEYSIPNIAGSFIRSKFEFENSFKKEQYKLSVTKPFISNDIKYGGGLVYYRLSSSKKNYLYYNDTTIITNNVYAKDDYNVWIGRSFKLKKSDYNKFINISLRYYAERYVSRPTIRKDTNLIFHDNNIVLGRITFIRKEHYKTSHLFGYGVTEDVPFGYTFSILSGLQMNNYVCRPYVGAYANWTKNIRRIGYFAYEIAGGTFVENKQFEDLKLGSKITYFSPYKKYGSIGVRHSLIPIISTTINPLYLESENFGKKIRELDQEDIFGKSIMVLKYEPYIYSDFGMGKFKLAFSIFADMGWISKKALWQPKWEHYGAYGFGFHLKNKRLTIPTFTVQLAYYPNVNDTNKPFNILARFSDRKLFDEEIIGEPELYFDF